MCGSYELRAELEELPDILQNNTPTGFTLNYAQQPLIKPNDPVIVLKNEGKTSTSIMLWGFISEWSKNPFHESRPKPFNARSETIDTNRLFRTSWKHKRCLLPATGFFEKDRLIRRKDSQLFWLAGIWNRWMSHEGSELETCCILTTQPNELIKPFHKRMPVVIPHGIEEEWIASIRNQQELKSLEKFLISWNSDGWTIESKGLSSDFYQASLLE